ncbi:hypothetical protein F5888DRAFT_1714577 [Russula emetica]|nr:hypothetical protein F5888DRAFT_1714577 [Russula emetica]
MPRSFLVLPAPTSRFRALVLAQMTDAPPRSTSSCASTPPCRPLAISVPVIPSSLFPSTLSIFVPTSLLILRFSAVVYSHVEHPVSQYIVSCERLSVSSPSNHHLHPRFNLVFARQF